MYTRKFALLQTLSDLFYKTGANAQKMIGITELEGKDGRGQYAPKMLHFAAFGGDNDRVRRFFDISINNFIQFIVIFLAKITDTAHGPI